MEPSLQFDSDADAESLDLPTLRRLVHQRSKGLLWSGRALMELGRRTKEHPELLLEVTNYVRAESNAKAITVGTVTVSQMGLAGLIASGAAESIRQGVELARATGQHGEGDLRHLVAALGGTWPQVSDSTADPAKLATFRRDAELALGEQDPVTALRGVVIKALNEQEHAALLAELNHLRASLRDRDREADEDTVMDVMDFMVGWCSPS